MSVRTRPSAVADRKNPTNRRFRSPDTQHMVAARERGPSGETRITVVDVDESYGAKFVLRNVTRTARLLTDFGGWSGFGRNPRGKVNHSLGYKNDKGVHINGVESLWRRVRAAERGVYFHIRGVNAHLFAFELAWREDCRRVDNGELWQRLVHALTHQPKSEMFAVYWQRWTYPDSARRRRRG